MVPTAVGKQLALSHSSIFVHVIEKIIYLYIMYFTVITPPPSPTRNIWGISAASKVGGDNNVKERTRKLKT
jgi:hypothetical protein